MHPLNASRASDTHPGHITFQQESPMSTPSAEGPKSGQMWRRLLDLGSEIDRWRFVADYDHLTEMVWDIWKPRSLDRSFHSFAQVLREEIARGDRYASDLMEILPNKFEVDEDLKEWVLELSELLFKVHRAVSALGVRLEMVETGLVRQYPNVLCPPHLDV
jgi:hypothetical protein